MIKITAPEDIIDASFFIASGHHKYVRCLFVMKVVQFLAGATEAIRGRSIAILSVLLARSTDETQKSSLLALLQAAGCHIS